MSHGLAIEKFLATAPTESSFAELSQVVTFESVCRGIIEGGPLRPVLVDTYTHALRIDGFIQATFLKPVASGNDALVMDFIETVSTERTIDTDTVHSLLKEVLPGLTQLMSVLGYHPPTNYDNACRRLISSLLHLFDAESTLLAQLSARAIESAVTGKLIIAHVDATVVSNISDETITKWRTDSQSRDPASAWLLPLIGEMEKRLDGKAKIFVEEIDAMKDTISVRAASLLISMADHSPCLTVRAKSQKWFEKIILRLYHTDDLLLRLTAGELVIQEFPKSELGLRYIHDSGLEREFCRDMMDESADLYLRLGLMRILSNISSLIPESRQQLVTESALLKVVAKFLNCPKSDPEFAIKRSASISCIGAIASGFNTIGIEALARSLPSWLDELANSLRGPSEDETMAALQALLTLLKDTDAPQSGPDRPGTLEEQVTPCILSLIQSKPFPYITEMCYRVMTAFVKRQLLAPLAAFCARADLQELLFTSVDPPAVKHAKHDFVKLSVRHHVSWLEQNCANRQFFEAMKWYADSGAFSQPPQYKPMMTAIADEAEH